MTLSFTQIFYLDEQRQECYDFASCYRNNQITDYFENVIIANLVPQNTHDYIGVCSWALRGKRQQGKCPMILNIYGNDNLSEEKILNSGADIINLRPFSQGHQMLSNSAQWHAPNWAPAIEELKKFIHIPEEVKTPIYENAFIARSDIYKSYVSDYLIPVMEFMSTRDIFFSDSGYAIKKERTDPEAVKRYQKISGRQDWPIAPFILERLFSIWIDDEDFKIDNA